MGGGSQRSRTFYGTEVAAAQELSRLTAKRAVVAVSRRRVTLYDYLGAWQDEYRQRCERMTMARSSWKEHESNVRLYLRPALEDSEWKDRRLGSFEADELVDLANGFRLAGGGEPSNSMRRSVRKTLVMSLGQAVEDGIISTNPLNGMADWSIGQPTVFVPDLVQLHKVAAIMGSMPSLVTATESVQAKKARLKARREGEPARMVSRVREGAARPWLEWMLLVTGWTGLRIGELLGLRLEDVDSNNRFLRVRQSATVSGGRYREGDTKSKAGVRIVPILPDAESAISALEDRAYAMPSKPTHLFAGGGRRASRLAADGSRKTVSRPAAIGYSEISRELREACRIAVEQGVIPEPFTLHALRHTFCSALLSAGVSEEKVSVWAGHSSPIVTRNVYAVAMPGNMETVAAEVGAQVADYFGRQRTPYGVRVAKLEEMRKRGPEEVK